MANHAHTWWYNRAPLKHVIITVIMTRVSYFLGFTVWCLITHWHFLFVCLRIKPLSEALADLYKLFNALKSELVELSANFNKVEAFVDDLQAGKFVPPTQRPVQALPPRLGAPRLALRSRLGPNRSNMAKLMSVRRRGRIATPRS